MILVGDDFSNMYKKLFYGSSQDPHFREPVETATAEELMKKVWVPKQDSTISLLREMQKGIATVVSHAGAARIRQNTISTELAKVPTLR